MTGRTVPRYVGRPGWGYRILSLAIWAVNYAVVSVIALGIRRVRIEGRRNIRQFVRTGGVMVSNHCGYYDPAYVAWAIAPRRTWFTTIPRNMNLPLVGWVIKYLGAFAIPVRNGYDQLSACFKRIQEQKGIIHFFPEVYMLLQNQRLQRFHRGPFRLAWDHEASVLPITLVWLPGRLIPAWKRLRLVASPPLRARDFRDDDELRGKVRDIMQGVIVDQRRRSAVEPIDPPFDPRDWYDRTRANHV